MNQCNLLTNVNYKVKTAPVKVTTALLNFGKLLQLMFTKVKLTITRGGILGEGASENVTPGLDSQLPYHPHLNPILQFICTEGELQNTIL